MPTHTFKAGDTVRLVSSDFKGRARIGATAIVTNPYAGEYIYIQWLRDDGLAYEQMDGHYRPEYFELASRPKGKKVPAVAPPGSNPKDTQGLKKPALHMVPPAALYYTALGFMDGDSKYDKYNWRKNKVIASIYVDAALRHLESWLDGEECADDSGVPHLGHAMASIAIIIDALETGNLIDDRPDPGVAAKLTEKFKDVVAKIAERKAARLTKQRTV